MLTRPDLPKSGKIVTRPDPRVHPTRGKLCVQYLRAEPELKEGSVRGLMAKSKKRREAPCQKIFEIQTENGVSWCIIYLERHFVI